MFNTNYFKNFILSLHFDVSFAVPHLVLDDKLLYLQEDGDPGLGFRALYNLWAHSMSEFNRKSILSTLGDFNLGKLINEILGANMIPFQEKQVTILKKDHMPASL